MKISDKTKINISLGVAIAVILFSITISFTFGGWSTRVESGLINNTTAIECLQENQKIIQSNQKEMQIFNREYETDIEWIKESLLRIEKNAVP